MDPIYVMCGTAAGIWLLSLVTGAVGLVLGARGSRRTFWPAMAASIITLALGYIGRTHFHFTYSRTVNSSHWGLDSNWFFLASLILGGVAVAVAIWRRPRAARRD